jgi:hypothetical protein
MTEKKGHRSFPTRNRDKINSTRKNHKIGSRDVFSSIKISRTGKT